jgi:gliding motility-associated-like protein
MNIFNVKTIFPMKSVLFFSLFLSFFAPSLYAYPHDVTSTDTCRIPTLITPNDDGQNDDFVIPCIPKDIAANKSELFVFSEWGERVALYKPYLNDWSGTYRYGNLPDGTYYYIFRLNPSVEPQRGYLTIFR